MLAPIKHLLSNYRIVLASGSPRRQELVQMLGLNAELCPSTFEENLNVADFTEFSAYIEATALGKAEEVFQRLSGAGGDDKRQLLVIAADTMVTLGKEIYGKPKDAADAVRMLSNLSGACNRVYTGVVLKHAAGLRQFTDTADVYFGNLTTAQIQDYVDSGDPLDKAGAYGVQGPGGALIPRIDGDFYTVMGLPLHRLCCELNALLLEDLN
ncbi:LOW QUALITY PROTEIN: dTTP/UTP pyrophosphatase [Drosophila busckii]|uniref:LOW QUALITY PROTEIN: dTTP/UTP pyrophosphatase n=1 Tax=Drosophila busckii TaxID=30019 RepID=UPI0014331619|nr:LOW QUALITY PROTEIN: dTTP/UTP pyrophosphatase [Drosophila busckii]